MRGETNAAGPGERQRDTGREKSPFALKCRSSSLGAAAADAPRSPGRFLCWFGLSEMIHVVAQSLAHFHWQGSSILDFLSSACDLRIRFCCVNLYV